METKVEQMIWAFRTAVLTLFLLLAAAVLAQSRPGHVGGGDLGDPVPAPLKLTLRGAVRLALKQNPEVQIANINLAESQQQRAISRSSLLPQVAASGSAGVHRNNFATLLGKPAPHGIVVTHGFQVIEGGAEASFPLFDLTLWHRYKAAGFAVNAGDQQRLSVRERTVLLVVSQYLGSLRAQARVRAAQSRVELAQALYKLAADRESTGVGIKLDTLRAQVELQNETQQLITAQTDLTTSLNGLERLLSIDPQQPVELADEMSFFETPAINLGESLSQAYGVRPELRALSEQEREAGQQKRAAADSRLPSVVAEGDWGYAGLQFNNTTSVYRYAVGIRVPLFTGGRIKAEIAKAALRIGNIQQQEEAERDRIAMEVKDANARLQSARHEVDVANLGIELAQEEVTQARDRFQNGVANNIDVITAQDELARASDNQINALYQYNQSRADLAHAMGKIEAVYSH